MTDDEKRRFFELAQKDAERYQAEVAAYGGEDALRKRKRAKKDPNAPKRALYVYIFYITVMGTAMTNRIGNVLLQVGIFLLLSREAH